jgi:hypothetical protein
MLNTVYPTLSENFFEFSPIFDSFDHSPSSPKAQSVDMHAVTETQSGTWRYLLNCALSNRIVRLQQKSGVKPSVFGDCAKLN